MDSIQKEFIKTSKEGGKNMNIKKESLWYIPLFCFAAGIFCNSILMRFEVLLFASENRGNNTIYFYTTCFIFLYAINFIIALIAAYFIFRRFSRKELFYSALLTVAIHVGLLIYQVATGEILNLVFYYISNWCLFFSEFTHEQFGSELIGQVIQCFVPFVIVLFGKKS